MRFQITIPVAISAGEHRGSGVAHWIEDDRLLLRTRFTLSVARPFGFALVPPGTQDRIIGLARVLEREPGTADRAPGWICEIERLSPEMRATLERFRVSLQPAPAPEAPASGLRFTQEDSSEPDTALSESTVARTTDTSANTAPDLADKVGRRALKGAVARSAVGRQPPAEEGSRGPGWLSDLDRRLKESRLDDLPPPPPPSELKSPFTDSPMRLADEGAWHGELRPLGADDPSTEVAKFPFDEDDPTSVAEFSEEPSGGSFALLSDALIDEAEQAANWSAVQRESKPRPAVKPEPAHTPSPFDLIDALDDPFADLAKPPPDDDLFSTPPADKPSPKAPPKASPPKAAPPPPSAADDWLAGMLSAPSTSDRADAAAVLGMHASATPEPTDDFLAPGEHFDEDFTTDTGSPAVGTFSALPEEPEEEVAPRPPTASAGMSIVPREPSKPAADRANFRYNAAQRMVDVSWRTVESFARDQRDQLENRVLHVPVTPGAHSGEKLTVKLALPDGQVLAMPAEVIGQVDGGFDVELTIPKPAQQKLRRLAQGA